MKTNNVRKN